MADNTIIGGESREQVAFQLLRLIAQNEGKQINRDGAERAYVLNLYYECLHVTMGGKPR